MGCDIHLYVERRENGQWVTCDTWEDDEGCKRVPFGKWFYHDRNYDLFAIFADVRNGSGFAGCKTGDGFNIIAEPRGIPEDACREYRIIAADYGADGHSHSWLTVAEIMAFDWTQTTHREGIVGPREWARWRLTGEPHGWSGGIFGGNIVNVSPEQMEKAAIEASGGKLWDVVHDQGEITGKINAALGGDAHTRVRWQIAYYQSGQQFLGTVLPRLWRLGAPDDVRITFFFDN